MLDKIKASLKGISKSKLAICLNQYDNVFIVESEALLNNVEKHYIIKAVKSVNKDLQVFFR